MAADKEFLTYNQQMKKLRDKKKIDCGNTKDKTTLVRMGYFNLVNGYKEPFICGKDNNGNHIYIANTSLSNSSSLIHSPFVSSATLVYPHIVCGHFE